MFGYATDETEECMPLTVVLAHRLNAKIAALRRSGEFWWARPDSKTQVIITNHLFWYSRIQVNENNWQVTQSLDIFWYVSCGSLKRKIIIVLASRNYELHNYYHK